MMDRREVGKLGEKAAQKLLKKRGYRIAYLDILLCPMAAEKIIIRESLYPCSLSDGQAPALGRIIVDIVVTILADVRSNCCSRH